MPLITISKIGHADLQIHPAALDEHRRLGWAQVENSAPKSVDKPGRKAKPKADVPGETGDIEGEDGTE